VISSLHERSLRLKTYSLDLNFIDDRKSKLPRRPIAEIYVKTYTARADGVQVITPECVTIEELEYQIERLKKELTSIATRARTKFEAEKTRSN
jgi:hypothetical protein